MRTCWALLLCCCWSVSIAQTTDADGRSNLPPVYNDVSGTAFLIRDWSDGVIRFTSGRVATQFKLKFDCIKNQIHLQFNGTSFSPESKVKEFVIYTNGKQKDSMLFRKGFPATEKANEETYYELVSTGKTNLLCLHAKHITEESQIASNVIYRRIRDEKEYYLLRDGKMQLLPADKLLIVQHFNDKTELIQKFIADQQLKFREAIDFKKLIEYYNSL